MESPICITLPIPQGTASPMKDKTVPIGATSKDQVLEEDQLLMLLILVSAIYLMLLSGLKLQENLMELATPQPLDMTLIATQLIASFLLLKLELGLQISLLTFARTLTQLSLLARAHPHHLLETALVDLFLPAWASAQLMPKLSRHACLPAKKNALLRSNLSFNDQITINENS